MVEDSAREQDNAFCPADLYRVFERQADIEIRDTNKQNISHFVLKYDVDLSEGKAFRSFTMTFTSEHAKRRMLRRLEGTDLKEFHCCIHNVRMMLLSGSEGRPKFYQFIV